MELPLLKKITILRERVEYWERDPFSIPATGTRESVLLVANVPTIQKSRMRVDDRSGWLGCGFHFDAEAINLPVKLDALIFPRSV